MKRILQSSLIGFSLFVSCVSGDSSTATATANALCPMGREHVVESGGVLVWRDTLIGFCCKQCQPMFEALTSDEKIEALASVDVIIQGE